MTTIGDKLRYWRLTTGTPIEYILEQMLWDSKKSYDQYERDYLSDEFIIDCLAIIFGTNFAALESGPSLKSLKYYDRKELAKRAEQVVDKTGMSASNLAKRLGVAESTVANWTAGRTIPRLEIMAEMATLVDMDVKEFIEEGC